MQLCTSSCVTGWLLDSFVFLLIGGLKGLRRKKQSNLNLDDGCKPCLESIIQVESLVAERRICHIFPVLCGRSPLLQIICVAMVVSVHKGRGGDV